MFYLYSLYTFSTFIYHLPWNPLDPNAPTHNPKHPYKYEMPTWFLNQSTANVVVLFLLNYTKITNNLTTWQQQHQYQHQQQQQLVHYPMHLWYCFLHKPKPDKKKPHESWNRNKTVSLRTRQQFRGGGGCRGDQRGDVSSFCGQTVPNSFIILNSIGVFTIMIWF